MFKPYFHLHPTFLFRQLDNDDANEDKSHTDIFPGQTNIGHVKYQKQNFYSMSRSELQITVSHQLSAAILLLFILTELRYFAQRSYIERW